MSNRFSPHDRLWINDDGNGSGEIIDVSTALNELDARQIELEKKMAALERADSKPVQKDEQPAKVERYNAFGLTVRRSGVREGDPKEYAIFTRELIGVVVATESMSGWSIQLPGPINLYFVHHGFYRALVEHNTKAGIWERING